MFYSPWYSKSSKNSSYFNIVPGGGVDQESNVLKSSKFSNYFGRDCRCEICIEKACIEHGGECHGSEGYLVNLK